MPFQIRWSPRMLLSVLLTSLTEDLFDFPPSRLPNTLTSKTTGRPYSSSTKKNTCPCGLSSARSATATLHFTTSSSKISRKLKNPGQQTRSPFTKRYCQHKKDYRERLALLILSNRCPPLF